MSDYQGVIILESLASKDVLGELEILSTKVEKVEAPHRTPWLRQWTLHTVRVPDVYSWKIAEKISSSFDLRHGGAWYADFKSSTHHYIIFPRKIFFIERTNKEQYDQAKAYGLSLGIPSYQVDFHPQVAVWQR